MKMVPIGSHIGMLSPQLMNCLERIRRLWPCWRRCISGGSALTFQKSMPGPVFLSFSSCCLWIGMQKSQLL